jgi:hypothetical protein
MGDKTMISVKVTSNFDGDSIMRKVVEAGAQQLKQKLEARGISGLTIVPQKKLGGGWGLKLTGPQDQIDKAEKILRQK